MFSLVTQADGTSRGQPWVTYAVAAALLVGFLALPLREASQQVDAIDTQIEEAMAYFAKHPYLELDPRLLERAGGEQAIELLRDDHFTEQRERGLAVIPASIVDRTQQKLDRMTEAVFVAQAELPQWRMGVRDGSTPASNFVGHAVVHTTVPALLVSLLFFFFLASALEGAWGAVPLAGFCTLAVPLTAAAFTQLGDASGLPWIGAGGLIAALLGAYFVTSIRWPAKLLGGLSLPGFLMVAMWIPADHFLVRGLSLQAWSSGPFASYSVAFGFGVFAAIAIRQLGIEEKLRQRDEKNAEVLSNPVLDKALAAHEAGRAQEAYEMLKVEVEAKPKHRDLVLGYWTVARGCGAEDEAAPFLLGIIRQELQHGKRSEAASHWLEIAEAASQVQAEPALLVRLGEALIDEGQPNDALLTFARALDEPARITAPLALRIVRIARDLDPAMTGRAATLALADPHLDSGERERLESLTATLEPSAVRLSDSTDIPEPSEASGEIVTAAASGDTRVDPVEPGEGFAALEAEVSAPALAPSETDVESWNDPGLIEDLTVEVPEESVENHDYNAQDFGAVSLEEVSAEAGERDVDPDGTAPLLDGNSPDTSADQQASDTCDESELDPFGRTTAVEGIDDESDVADVSDVDLGAIERTLRLLSGVPIAIDADGIKLEIDDRGKTRIPFDRIEALAVAAVGGIGEKPVLLIDLVLNWMSLGGQPLKVVRLRSDRFRPGSLVPEAGSTVDALKALLAIILDGSGATPLPHAAAARGDEFVSFEDVDQYHAQVLMVSGLES